MGAVSAVPHDVNKFSFGKMVCQETSAKRQKGLFVDQLIRFNGRIAAAKCLEPGALPPPGLEYLLAPALVPPEKSSPQRITGYPKQMFLVVVEGFEPRVYPWQQIGFSNTLGTAEYIRGNIVTVNRRALGAIHGVVAA